MTSRCTEYVRIRASGSLDYHCNLHHRASDAYKRHSSSRAPVRYTDIQIPWHTRYQILCDVNRNHGGNAIRRPSNASTAASVHRIVQFLPLTRLVRAP